MGRGRPRKINPNAIGVNEIARATGLPYEAVDNVFAAILVYVRRGKDVQIDRFGSFMIRPFKERLVRRIATPEGGLKGRQRLTFSANAAANEFLSEGVAVQVKGVQGEMELGGDEKGSAEVGS